jgi:Spy/CpxP family protein refolding chaperone
MIMKMRTIIVSLLAVLLMGGLGIGVLAATTTNNEGIFDAGQPGPLRRLISGQIDRLRALRSELNLTSAQQQQIKQIVQSHRSEIAAVVGPIVQKKRALRDATSSPGADEQTIREAATELGKSIGDAAVLASKIKAEVRVVITPQQMRKIVDFRKESDQTVDQFIQGLSN